MVYTAHAMLAIGTVLQDRYRIIGPLGRGGMGSVYEARHTGTGASFALKETLSETPLIRAAFEHEARLLGKLEHEAFPRVTDYFSENDKLYLVMELVRGDDLAVLLRRRTEPFALTEVMGWAGQLLEALEVLHAYPVIHRDIKPANLKLTPRRRIKLLDFGIAKGVVNRTDGPITPLPTQSATLEYAPIEQILRVPQFYLMLIVSHAAQVERVIQDSTDARSDLYSLAATLYHLLTLRLPPNAPTRALAAWSGKPDLLQPPENFNPALPDAISRILLRAMALEREARYPNAAAMRQALEDYRQAEARRTAKAERRRYAAEQEEARQQTLADSFARATTIADKVPSQAADAEGFTDNAGELPMPERDKTPPVTLKKFDFVHEVDPVIIPYQPPVRVRLARRHSPARDLPLLSVLLAAVIAVCGYGLSKCGVFTGKTTPIEPPIITQNLPALPGVKLNSFNFTSVTLDRQGKVTAQPTGTAQSFQENLGGGMTLEMVAVPSGTFTMGSPESEASRHINEGPQHRVTVPAFFMGRYEVTQAQYEAVRKLPKVTLDLPPNPSGFTGDDTLPVDSVTWNEAKEFCARLSKATGRTYRLPTEAEWEYAARAGTTTPFAFGETIAPDAVNYASDFPYADAPKDAAKYRGKTFSAFSGTPNLFGLYNLHGNVFEWNEDEYEENYDGASTDGSAAGFTTQVDAAEGRRVLRGGAWNFYARACRPAFRYWYIPAKRDSSFGFRVVAAK